MSLRLTPDMLAAGYDFLRATEPFKRWKLPEADEVGFCTLRDRSIFGDVGIEDGIPIIRVSEARNGHAVTLLATLAHEMIHLRQFQLADSGNHNALFRRLAVQVCRAHGFDPKAF
jgi:hypothetical protein